MKRALVIALLLVSSTAFAIKPRIPNERNPPTDSPMEENREGGVDEPGEDPSRHFNFFNFSYGGKDEFGGPIGDGKMEEKDANGNVIRVVHEEEPMSAPFVLMLVNFGLLLIILAKYGWPVAGKLAADRHDQIKTALDEAAKLRDTAKTKLSEYETRVAGLDGEIKKLVDGIRADADADKARILKAAEAQAAQMKRDADLRIAAEIELARAVLTREITAAAASATEKLLRANVTTADQNKLVGNFISNVEKH
jgi:F-type H+-transporting ATPase subunit b